jgi:hypothetical protein
METWKKVDGEDVGLLAVGASSPNGGRPAEIIS